MNNKSTVSAVFLTMLKHSAYVAGLCSAGYFVVMLLLHFTNMELTNFPDWIFRIAIVLAVIWAVIGFRIRQGNVINFGRGFAVAMLTTLFLALFMAIVHFVYYDYVSPDYHQRFKEYYVPNSKLDMYNNLMKKRQDSLENETYVFTAKDTQIVENRMEEVLNRPMMKMIFTTNGKVLVYLVSTFIWGFVIAFPIAFMNRKTKK